MEERFWGNHIHVITVKIAISAMVGSQDTVVNCVGIWRETASQIVVNVILAIFDR